MGEEGGRRLVVVTMALSSFLNPFAGSAFNIALPSLGREFHLDAVTLGWAALAFTLSSAMLIVPFGRLADIRGRRTIFLYGMAIFTASSLALAAYPTALTLIPLRVAQGVGASMVTGTGMAILVSAIPAGGRGGVLGLNVAAVYMGASLGPSVGGMMTQFLGWRSIFLVNVILGLTIIALAVRMRAGGRAEAPGDGFDLAGAAIYSLSLLSLIYGFSLVPSLAAALPFAAGILGGLIFVWWESRVEHPVLDIAEFRGNRVFALSNLATLINYSATAMVGLLLSLYLQYIKGLGSWDAGLVMMAQPLVQVVFSPIAGRVSDRVEPRVVASAGMATTAVSILLLTLLTEETSLGVVVANLALLGLGFAFFSSPNTNAVMSSVDSRLYGVASATVSTMRQSGQMLSIASATAIFSAYIGRAEVTPPTYPLLLRGIKTAFSFSSALCFAGIAPSLSRGKVRRGALGPQEDEHASTGGLGRRKSPEDTL